VKEGFDSKLDPPLLESFQDFLNRHGAVAFEFDGLEQGPIHDRETNYGTCATWLAFPEDIGEATGVLQ
jgi:hypothetical protein